MRRVICSLGVLICTLLAAPVSAATVNGIDESTRCQAVQDAAKTAAEKSATAARQASEEEVRHPAIERLKSCVQGVLNPGWGITLGLPSDPLTALANQACSLLQSTASTVTGAASGNVQLPGGLSVGGGMNSSGTNSGAQINQNGNHLADMIWQSMKR